MEGEEAAKQTCRTKTKTLRRARFTFRTHTSSKTHTNIHLKVLVVVRIDAETGDEAVHHELHVGVLAARPPPEGFGRVEQQSLVGQGSHQVVEKQFSGSDSTGS